MQQMRDDMETNARDLGATIAKVSKSLDYLVIGEKAAQSKIDKAKKYGVTVLTEVEYRALIDQWGSTLFCKRYDVEKPYFVRPLRRQIKNKI